MVCSTFPFGPKGAFGARITFWPGFSFPFDRTTVQIWFKEHRMRSANNKEHFLELCRPQKGPLFILEGLEMIQEKEISGRNEHIELLLNFYIIIILARLYVYATSWC